MTTYSPFERLIARGLSASPGLKRVIKRGYQVAAYRLVADRSFRLALADSVSLEAVDETAVKEQVPNFFGYYDKSPWDKAMRRFVYHRGLRGAAIAIYVREDGKIREVGRSETWNFQQGCMTQWVPRNGGERLVFNGLSAGQFSSFWIDLNEDRPAEVIDWPVQAVAPDGLHFASLNYARLQQLRPDYGYVPEASNFSADLPDDRDGIWEVDTRSGQAVLVVTLKQLRDLTPAAANAGAHKVNHVLYDPSGSAFIFLYRWFSPNGKRSRLFHYRRDSAQLSLLLGDGMVSHYAWRGSDTVVAYARNNGRDGYHEINISSGGVRLLGEERLNRFGDGHPSISPCGRWMITDSYPDRARRQSLILYDLYTDCYEIAGQFLLPTRYYDQIRIDLHPRWSPDGTLVSIDSGHSGHRATYTLDLRGLLSRLS